ncbi:outer membrane beta-barrel protein [Shewanella sp. WXL01]|uniref:Porin n=2 Tax=Shewanellaceae TaxID=267890 RepID=A0A411PN27_9GAMM|nr:outer membrane beta-barrel protein [Shewanella sp. WXL01]QBF84947.1 hypothetical protein EXU30_16305 [Shewanella maritima]
MPVTMVQAGEFDLGLSEHRVSVGLSNSLNQNANLDLGYTYHENKGHLAEVAAHMVHQSGPHHFQVGPKYVHMWHKHAPNGSAVAVGGEYGLSISKNLSLHGSAYYAPSVLSFSNVDGYVEYGAKVQFNLNPNMGLYAGYRYQKLKFDHASSQSFEDGFHIGGAIKF